MKSVLVTSDSCLQVDGSTTWWKQYVPQGFVFNICPGARLSYPQTPLLNLVTADVFLVFLSFNDFVQHERVLTADAWGEAKGAMIENASKCTRLSIDFNG